MSHGIKGETSAQGTPKGTTICGIVGVVFGALWGWSSALSRS